MLCIGGADVVCYLGNAVLRVWAGGGDRCVRELKVARVGKDKLARFDKVLAQVNTQGYARFQW